MKTATLLFALAAALAAQDTVRFYTTAALPGGIELTITTESDRSDTRFSTGGSHARSGGTVHRLIVDKDGDIRFAYDIEVEMSPAKVFLIRLKPLSPEYERRLRAEPWFPRGSAAAPDGRLPTFAAVREIPSVMEGDRVTVDLLADPVTGEKIRDAMALGFRTAPVRYVEFLTRRLGRTSTSDLEFRGGRVTITGKSKDPETYSLEGHRAAGPVIALYIQGRGGYFFAAEPPSGYPFQQAALVERGRLAFMWNNEWFEFRGEGDIVKAPRYTRIWVLHVPGYSPGSTGVNALENPQSPPPRLFLEATDDIDNLIRK